MKEPPRIKFVFLLNTNSHYSYRFSCSKWFRFWKDQSWSFGLKDCSLSERRSLLWTKLKEHWFEKNQFFVEMQLSLLLLIAAVPLLGEPQMSKETNKEGKATRQENRKKIRKEEFVPSCQTDSTSSTDERSGLSTELPNTAKLFGQPGTRHRSPFGPI